MSETLEQVFLALLGEWELHSQQIHQEWGSGPGDDIDEGREEWLARWGEAVSNEPTWLDEMEAAGGW